MKNASFQVTTEGMPKISLRSIMRKTWAEYRFQMKWRDDQSFDRALFARLLRDQWQFAKLDRDAAIERAAEEARLNAAPAIEQRTATIRAELRDMEFGEQINWTRHGALRTELARMGA